MADQDNQDAGHNTGHNTGQDTGQNAVPEPGQQQASSPSPLDAPPLGAPGVQGGGAGAGTDAGTGEASGKAQIGAAPTAAAVAATSWYKSTPFWVALLLLLALAAAIGWLAWQKYTAEQLVKSRHDQEEAELKRQNDEYEAYLNQLRALLELDPCDIPPAIAGIRPPQGRSLPVLPNDAPGTGAPSDAPSQGMGGAAGQPEPAQDAQGAGNEDVKQAPAEKAERKLEAREPANIAELLEQNTVLILALQGKGVSMGTGFFIAPDTIMTNAHVVGNAQEAVYINKFVGSVRSAKVILRTRDNGLDFAVLRTQESIPVKPLQLQKNTVQRMEKVSAWGFPAAVTGDDPKFMGLLGGNAEAAPEVVYTEGSVSVVLEKKPPVIVHTATVSQGNSGGPLVNEQGEVVGINTMIKLDGKSYRQSSLAIPSSVMAQFLEANKVSFTVAPEAAKTDAGTDAKGGAKQ